MGGIRFFLTGSVKASLRVLANWDSMTKTEGMLSELCFGSWFWLIAVLYF